MAENATPKQTSELSSAELLEHDGLEFDAIEAAVFKTPQGRWFLREYARRVRAHDHDRIESALARIETRLSESASVYPAPDAAVTVPHQLVHLAESLRARGVDEQTCAHIEAQAHALMDAASRRNLAGAVEALEKGFREQRKMPAA